MYKFLFLFVVLAVGAGWYFWSGPQVAPAVSETLSQEIIAVLGEEATSTPETEVSTSTNSVPPALLKLVVKLTDGGFEPKDSSVQRGQIVEFVIEGKDFHWPASDLHPTHEIYPELDADRPLSAGESWSFKFEKVGKWSLHDHLHPRLRGSVEVNLSAE